MALELFANLPTTTVSSGGTDAPASGTQETWTVASSAEFPAVSSSATPPTQFHVADALASASSEMIAVTNISGTTWTVTRGSESTTPVTHAAGFTIYQVVTAGALQQASRVDWLNVVTMFGADPTGTADSTTAFTSAVAALPSTGGVIYVPAGTYKVSSTVTVSIPAVTFIGAGRWSTVIDYTGSGDCIRMYSSQSYTAGWGGGIKGITIDGTSASAGACGAHIGDIYQLELDFAVRNFQGSGSKGIWFDNQYYWTEDMYGHVFAEKNTANVVFDNSANQSGSATGSFDRALLTIVLDAKGVGNGVVFQNGAFIYDGRLDIQGNMDYSTTATQYWALTLTGPSSFSFTATHASPAVFTASGSYYSNGMSVTLSGGSLPGGFSATSYYVVNASGDTFELSATSGGSPINSSSTGSGNVISFPYSKLEHCILNIGVECDATSGTQPGTIDFGTAAGNQILECTGIIDFSGSNAFASANNYFSSFFFDGPVYGNSSLFRVQGLGQNPYFNGAVNSNASLAAITSISIAHPGSAVSGIILEDGISDNQLITVVNYGTGSMTFGTQSSSHVAGGTAISIPAQQGLQLCWLSSQSTWFPLGT